VMSTHQMHQVEELCDRILLIDEGEDVLYGNLDEIRRRFSGHAVLAAREAGIKPILGAEMTLDDGSQEEAAAYLRVASAPFYCLAAAGEIAATRIGRVWRFSWRRLDEWMDE
ncbi:unnamed protein product, partial [marine sediment metagenome]